MFSLLLTNSTEQMSEQYDRLQSSGNWTLANDQTPCYAIQISSYFNDCVGVSKGYLNLATFVEV